MPESKALTLATDFLCECRVNPHVRRARLAGSLRRGSRTPHDVDIVIEAKSKINPILRWMRDKHHGRPLMEDSCEFIRCGVWFNVVVVHNFFWAPTLTWLTGSRAFNLALRQLATHRGYELHPRQLLTVPEPYCNPPAVWVSTETELFQRLGLRYVPPRHRTGNEDLSRYALENP